MLLQPANFQLAHLQVHPVSLGIFNFVNAWSMMFWPVMLADRKGQAVKQRFPLWLGTQAMLSTALLMLHF